MITLRPFDYETDLPAFISARNAEGGAPLTPDRLLQDHALRLSEGRPFYQRTAVNNEGIPVGFTDIGRGNWDSPSKLHIRILVHRAQRGRGIGTTLYQDALDWVRTQGATILAAAVRDDDLVSLAFMERRGFSIERQRFISELDVSAFDETPFVGVLRKQAADGIRLGSLAELGDTEENRHKLYDINILAAADEPAHDGTIVAYEEFSKMVFDAWWFRQDGQFLAFDGERAVGIAAVGHDREHNRMFNAFTGTHPEYRGRGVALALKLLTIRLAKREGVAIIRTNNDSLNPSMLAINRKLGYVRQPGQYQMTKTL
jgi:GNAT superfamily N-acetyltransferase